MMEMLRNGEKINTLEVQFTKFRLVELEKSEVWEENMSTYILTSMFPDGIHGKNRELFQTLVTQRKSFAFVASEFEKDHGTTDCYFHLFLNMLEESGIYFENSYVIDGRMDAAEEALKAAIGQINRAATKGVYHKNTAARKVSRLTLAVNKMA